MLAPIIVIVVAVITIFFLGYSREIKAIEQSINQLIQGHGKANVRKMTNEELKAVKAYCDYKGMAIIDDITWNDLDMNQIYRAMNYCLTSAGDETLYYRLRNPFVIDRDWEHLEEVIETFRKDDSLRKEFYQALYRIGRSGKYSIHTYLKHLENEEKLSNVHDVVLDSLYIPAIIICFFNVVIGIVFVFAVMIANIATYFKKKKKLESYIVCIHYIARVLENSRNLGRIKCDLLKEELSDLVNITNEFKNFKRFSTVAMGNAGNSPLGIIMDYVRMLTHIDLIKMCSMIDIVNSKQEHILNAIEIIGNIDCYISIGEYRQCVDVFCVPSLSENTKGIRIEEGVHPLIINSVPNSIATNNSILLTGSNASGKSTFLKMVAVNCILSQSIHTALAKIYEAPYYHVYSSLSLKDSISSGDSFYMAEIKALKRIIDAANRGEKVLGFVDEILKGTNTVERIAASSAILANIMEKNVCVFAATHDIELTNILEKYENYHFEEKMTEDDIEFSYMILPGRATTRNAIKLLDIMGYDKSIIEASNEHVKSYEQKGNWY